MGDTPRSIFADAREQMQSALAGVRHPITEDMVQDALDVVRVALAKQRRMIARQINAEARRAQRGLYPDGTRSISYDAGMRRAARLAAKDGERP